MNKNIRRLYRVNRKRHYHVFNTNMDLYFISSKEIDNLKLFPRVPSNYFTDRNLENNVKERICFCKSVSDCLMALGRDVEYKEFFVYTLKDIDSHTLYKPDNIAVPDSNFTQEIWVTEEADLIYRGKVKCLKADRSYEYSYNKNRYKGDLFRYNYEWVS